MAVYWAEEKPHKITETVYWAEKKPHKITENNTDNPNHPYLEQDKPIHHITKPTCPKKATDYIKLEKNSS